MEIKERKRVQLTADIFLCAQAALMQIVEIFSTDQQLSDPPSCPTNSNPTHSPRTTEPTTHRTVEPSYNLSCCCDWFCLMELERGNNFIELDFNVRQKARYFLISFSLLQLPQPLSLPPSHSLLSVGLCTIRWSLKETRALSTCPTQVLSACSWTRFCLKL